MTWIGRQRCGVISTSLSGRRGWIGQKKSAGLPPLIFSGGSPEVVGLRELCRQTKHHCHRRRNCCRQRGASHLLGGGRRRDRATDQRCATGYDMDQDEPHKDYYKVLEVNYDATDDDIRLSYRRLALKWHPDKQKGNKDVTAKFQEINEAYRVLSDADKRIDYDLSGTYEIHKYTLGEYLNRFKGMILTSHGLGINQASKWARDLMEIDHMESWNRDRNY